MRVVDGRPSIANDARSLGVRVPPAPKVDINIDSNGCVAPNSGGMSVVPDWRRLQFYRIPRRLRNLLPEASGSNSDACWRYGHGPFMSGEFADGLQLRVDNADHALVEPNDRIPFHQFEEFLSATRDGWIIDET